MPASTPGRSKTVTVLDEDGHLAKKRARVSRQGWDVFLENHHEPYISLRQPGRGTSPKISGNASMMRPMGRGAYSAEWPCF